MVDYLTKMVQFTFSNKIIIGEKTSKLFLIMFFDIMAFMKISFLIMNPICIQILEEVFKVIGCEGEVVVSLPPLDGWTNNMS